MRLGEGGCWGRRDSSREYLIFVTTERSKVFVEKGGQAAWTKDRLLRPPGGELNHSSALCTRAGKR